SSQGELEPVFQAMLENATHICEAKYGNLYQYSDGAFHLVASHSPSPELASERLRGPPIHPLPGTGLGRVLETNAAVHIADVLTDPSYPHDNPLHRAAERGGVRTLLAVPMIKEAELVGAITIVRQEVRPFTEKQIELVKNFAAQAVIAIENTRLLNELRQRTDDLGRSVNELQALGEVSQAVNSTLDLKAVLSTIVSKAVQLSGTEAGTIYEFDEIRQEFKLRATYGMSEDLISALENEHIGLDEPSIAAAITQREPMQVADLVN